MDAELTQHVADARQQGKKIGLVQGSWDLFHLGHLRYIIKAKSLCDFLVVAMDSDAKIRKRKGNGRPIIPEQERYDFISSLSPVDGIVVKQLGAPKWNLIKTLRPDVLIAIKENYTDEEVRKLEKIVGRVAILPRQSASSTSDKIRKITIMSQRNRIDQLDQKLAQAITETKMRLHYTGQEEPPIPELFAQLSDSTDWVCPVAAACRHDGQWYYGANHSDFNIPKYDVEHRTELYYGTVEHAEINLLKKMGDVEQLDSPVWITLFPCDKCMKILIDKGVRQIYYLEDHAERNWSKRSHALAEKHNIKTIKVEIKDGK